MLRASLYVALLLIVGLGIFGLVASTGTAMPTPLVAATVGAIGLSCVALLLLFLMSRQAVPTPTLEALRPAPEQPLKKEPKREPEPRKPARSEAITLLATLQREARFVDFLKESLDTYSDAQIGAVAREVHRDCGQVVDRLFALAPLVDAEESSTIEVPARFDPGRYRLTGHVTGDGPFRGSLAHHGWVAEKCDVPAWSGTDQSSLVVAPAEVEL